MCDETDIYEREIRYFYALNFQCASQDVDTSSIHDVKQSEIPGWNVFDFHLWFSSVQTGPLYQL